MHLAGLEAVRRSLDGFVSHTRVSIHRPIQSDFVFNARQNNPFCLASQNFVYAAIDLPIEVRQVLVFGFALRTRTEHHTFRRTSTRPSARAIIQYVIRFRRVHVRIKTGCDPHRQIDFLRSSRCAAQEADVLLAEREDVEAFVARQLGQQWAHVEMRSQYRPGSHLLFDPAHHENIRRAEHGNRLALRLAAL